MAQWNKNTVPKCEKKCCSDEVLVTVEKKCKRNISESAESYLYSLSSLYCRGYGLEYARWRS